MPGGEGGGFGRPRRCQASPEGVRNATSGGRFHDFRNFGPGVIVGSEATLPVCRMACRSASRNKTTSRPTSPSLRGNDKWEITGDDAEALKKLPDDLRPAVERMLHGGGGWAAQWAASVTSACQTSAARPRHGSWHGRQPMREQLERMEKRLDEMQRRMHGPTNQPADKPKTSKKDEVVVPITRCNSRSIDNRAALTSAARFFTARSHFTACGLAQLIPRANSKTCPSLQQPIRKLESRSTFCTGTSRHQSPSPPPSPPIDRES